jgi:hypothetical protein
VIIYHIAGVSITSTLCDAAFSFGGSKCLFAKPGSRLRNWNRRAMDAVRHVNFARFFPSRGQAGSNPRVSVADKD